MKSRLNMKGLMSIIPLPFSIPICANEDLNQSIRHEWVESHEVAVCEDGVYIDSNKGLMWLKVIDYDRENDRYLVEFPVLD